MHVAPTAHLIYTQHRPLTPSLSLSQLASLASFFRKPHYDTWIHPRSSAKHTIDHILVSRGDITRFSDAGTRAELLFESDRRTVGCSLWVKEIDCARGSDAPRRELKRSSRPSTPTLD